jgi:hypothetical protein
VIYNKTYANVLDDNNNNEETTATTTTTQNELPPQKKKIPSNTKGATNSNLIEKEIATHSSKRTE